MFSPKKKKKDSREASETRGEGQETEEGKEKQETRSSTAARVAARAAAVLMCGSRSSSASGSRSVKTPVRSSRSVSAGTPARISAGTSPGTSADTSPVIPAAASTSADTSAGTSADTSTGPSVGIFSGASASTSAGTSSETHAGISSSTDAGTVAVTSSSIPAIIEPISKEEMNGISEADLKKLAIKYKQSGIIPYGRSMLTNGARLVPLAELMKEWTIEFKTPGRAWLIDGTFFVYMVYGGRYDVAIFTLEEKGLTTIYCGLMTSCRIQYSRPVVFKNIHESIYSTVRRSIREKNLKVLSEKKYFIFKIKKSEALRMSIKIPETVEVKEIQTIQADMVYATWTEYYPGSIDYVRTLIRMNGGYVAISRPEGKQLSWVLKSVMGQIDYVESKREFLRQGNASLLLKIMAKEIATEGNDPIAFVPTNDETAQNLFKKLGFENVGMCHDIEVIDAPEETRSPTTSLQSPTPSIQYSALRNSLSDST